MGSHGSSTRALADDIVTSTLLSSSISFTLEEASHQIQFPFPENSQAALCRGPVTRNSGILPVVSTNLPAYKLTISEEDPPDKLSDTCFFG